MTAFLVVLACLLAVVAATLVVGRALAWSETARGLADAAELDVNIPARLASARPRSGVCARERQVEDLDRLWALPAADVERDGL